MQNVLLKKYIEFKKKSYMSYATAFYKLYPTSDGSIWKNEDEYEKILSSIFDIYLEKYFFQDIRELKILNNNELTTDEFMLALSLAIIADTYKNRYNDLKTKYKTGLYNLTIILYVILNVDRDINVLNESITLNSIINTIRRHFQFINQEHIIDKNPFIIDILANKYKDNKRLLMKFFNSLESGEAYNKFTKYDDNSYFVQFVYENDLLDKYKLTDVERVYEKYHLENEFNEICFDLSSITILKMYSIGKNVFNLILPITAKYLKEEKYLKIIENNFNQPYIKDRIKFSVMYSEYSKNRDAFNVLRELGFKLVLYMDKNEMILDYSNIRLDLSVYAKDRFIDNNPKFLSFTNQKNIECIVVSKNDYISEKDLLKKCEEE